MRDLARAFREVLFFLILSFIASTSIAKRGFCNQQAGILTLEGAIEEGLSRAPQIHNARAVVEETSWKKAEFLSAGFLPKLSVSGTQYLSIQYSVTTLTGLGSSPTNFLGFFPTTTLGLDLNIPVFDGLANVRNLQGASLAEEAAKKELARAEFQLRKEIQLS